MPTVSELVARVTVTGVDEASAKLQAMSGETEAAGAGFSKLAALGAVVLVAGLAAVAAKSVQMAGDFQSATTTLVTGAGEMQSNLAMVRQGILQMAVDTGTSTKQLVDGMFMIESAGYHGADGLRVLQVAAEGAKVGNAQLGTVANAVTTVMKDFGISAKYSTSAMNFLVAIVQNGKTTMQALAGSMSQVLPTASAVGARLIDVGAAMATMTGEGVGAAQAATFLRQMLISLSAPASAGAKSLKAIGLTAQEVSSQMKNSLPDALKLIMTHLAETYKVGSPEYVTALRNIAGGSKQMQGMLDLTGRHFKDFQQNVQNVSTTLDKGQGVVVGWSKVQGDFNFKLDKAKEVLETFMIKLGTGLLPILGRLLGVVPTIADYFSNWKDHTNVLIPVAAGLAAILVTVLVPAVWSLAAGVIAATWPLLAIGGAVALITSLFLHWYQTNTGFKTFIDNLVNGLKQLWAFIQANFIPTVQRLGEFFQSTILPVLRQVGSFIVGTFKPAWDQLAITWKQNLLPGLQMLWGLFQQLWPVLKIVGIVLIASVVVPILAAIAVIVLIGVAIMKFVALLIQGWGLAISFTGAAFSAIGTTITNFKNLVGNVFSVIGTFIHGKLTDIKNTVGGAFSALGTFVHDGLTNMKNAVSSLFSEIGNIVHNFFTWLYNHNYYVHLLVDQVVGKFNDLKAKVGEIFSAIGTFIHDKLMLIKSIVGSIFSYIGTFVQDKLNLIKSIVGSVFSYIGEWIHIRLVYIQAIVGAVWNWISSFISTKSNDTKNTVGNAFSALGSSVRDKITVLWNWLTGFMGGWPTQAFNWGKNLIQGFINGIGSMIGGVANAAQNVAQTVAHFLGFHSPAKEGPGRDADKWMPNLMHMFTQGIIAGTPSVQRALSGILSPIGTSLSVNATGSYTPFASGAALARSTSNSNSGAGSQPIVLVMDGQVVARGLMPHITNQIRYSTGVRF